MNALERLHEKHFSRRRVRVLCDRLLELIPSGARVLDVGCGDGLLAREILRRRPDVRIEGIDVQSRADTAVPVQLFDGQSFPFPDASFDVLLFIDVLHHTEDPTTLLREAARIARGVILIKDHASDRLFAVPTLKFMDRIGNARHGVALPYNYWPRRRWLEAFDHLGLKVLGWTDDLGLYPPPASWVFGGSLHFLARVSSG